MSCMLCSWATHGFHLFLAPLTENCSFEKPSEEGLYICLSLFSDLNQTKPDRQVSMSFAFPFTDMNEYKGKSSEKMESYYVPFVWFLCDRREEMKHIRKDNCFGQ